MVRKAPPPPPPPPPPEDDPHQPPPPPKKKKGRPSLLDLQRRALILQQQQQKQRQSKQDGPHEAPNSPAPLRRSTRRNPLPPPPPTPAEDDDDDEHRGRRREKKLKLVLENGSSDRPADSQKRTERPNSASHSKVMGGAQGERSDSGPTTPLPDKKTLLFILDRLQKKDKYGVYSEPVDPEELPDYHEIIEHPMDFSTVRKKLADGVYANLEQFERDVFLISSNAMQYNAPDTIYYRQARSIEELAKKSFENVRQGIEENEPEPEVKVIRRGRPPGKSSAKKPVGRPPAEPSVMDSTDATPATTTNKTSWVVSSNDSVRKGSLSNMMGFMSPYPGLQVPNNSENRFQMADHRFGRNEESLGFMQRGLSMRFGKKISVSEDNRRSTYLQPLPSSGAEHPILSTFLGEKKQLVPIGVFIEHAYARSLVRFAANLGPVGWEIAAKWIERALPPGTPFGRGWVGENEMPHLNQHQTHASSTLTNEQSVASVNPAVSTTEATCKMPDHQPDSSFAHIPPNSSQGSSVSSLHNSIPQQKDVAQTQQNLQVPPLHKMNGFNRFYVDLFQGSTLPMQSSAEGDLRHEVPMTHAQLLDMVSRTNNVGLPPAAATHFEAEKARFGNLSYMSNSKLPFHPSSDPQLLSMSSTEMGTSGDHISHPARGPCELERVNFSNSGTLNSTGSFIHPLAMRNSSSMLSRNPGPKNHGFSFNSAVGNHTAAELSAPADSCIANPCSIGGAQKNIEANHETIVKPSNNMLPANQHPEKENTCNAKVLHSKNPLPDPAQHSFQEPSVQFPKSDSICPDLNSCIPDDRLANSRSSCRIPEV